MSGRGRTVVASLLQIIELGGWEKEEIAFFCWELLPSNRRPEDQRELRVAYRVWVSSSRKRRILFIRTDICAAQPWRRCGWPFLLTHIRPHYSTSVLRGISPDYIRWGRKRIGAAPEPQQASHPHGFFWLRFHTTDSQLASRHGHALSSSESLSCPVSYIARFFRRYIDDDFRRSPQKLRCHQAVLETVGSFLANSRHSGPSPRYMGYPTLSVYDLECNSASPRRGSLLSQGLFFCRAAIRAAVTMVPQAPALFQPHGTILSPLVVAESRFWQTLWQKSAVHAKVCFPLEMWARALSPSALRRTGISWTSDIVLLPSNDIALERRCFFIRRYGQDTRLIYLSFDLKKKDSYLFLSKWAVALTLIFLYISLTHIVCVRAWLETFLVNFRLALSIDIGIITHDVEMLSLKKLIHVCCRLVHQGGFFAYVRSKYSSVRTDPLIWMPPRLSVRLGPKMISLRGPTSFLSRRRWPSWGRFPIRSGPCGVRLSSGSVVGSSEASNISLALSLILAKVDGLTRDFSHISPQRQAGIHVLRSGLGLSLA